MTTPVIDRSGAEVPLQTYGYNITAWGGSRQAPPTPRGDNVTVPHVPGSLPMPKMPSSRVISLSMWVQGSDKYGNYPTDMSAQRRFRQNWAQLRRLLWNRQEPYRLIKRFFDESGVLRAATATVEFGSGLSPEAQGGSARSQFSVDLVLADPFFYSDPVTIPFDSSGATQPASWTGPVLGDWYARRVSILGSAVGANNPAVTITANGVTANWQIQAQGLGGTVSIDSPTQEALVGSDTYAPDVIHDAANDWFLIPPEPSVLIAFGADGGSWSGMLTYYPAWL
jgi:hypothetical protein